MAHWSLNHFLPFFSRGKHYICFGIITYKIFLYYYLLINLFISQHQSLKTLYKGYHIQQLIYKLLLFISNINFSNLSTLVYVILDNSCLTTLNFIIMQIMQIYYKMYLLYTKTSGLISIFCHYQDYYNKCYSWLLEYDFS